MEEYNKKLLDLREYYISSVEKRIPNIYINGDRYDRLPGNANISFKNVNRNILASKIK